MDIRNSEGPSASAGPRLVWLSRSSLAEGLLHMSPGSSSRLTLSLGGSGIVLATLAPLVAETVEVFPVPYDLSWLNQSWQPLFVQLSAGVLLVAFTILAVGIGKESGIAGASIIGKFSLILFPVAGFALSVIVPASGFPLGTSRTVLALWGVGLMSIFLLGLASLIVASIVVFRAGVIRGVARWGLIVLAIETAATTAVSVVRSVEAAEVWYWGRAVGVLLQLVIGVLYLYHGRTAALKQRLEVVHEQ